MLTLRPTKKLASRLGIKMPDAPPRVLNRVADWCAHEFMVGRYRHLIFCNTASLYPVVTHARGVKDEHSLIDRLIETLKLNLEGAEAGFQFERRIVPELAEVQFAPIPDRSVLGAINELVFAAKWHLHSGELSPAEIRERLHDTPLKALGYNNPVRVFLSLTGRSTN